MIKVMILLKIKDYGIDGEKIKNVLTKDSPEALL
ncbi:hypothetical protein SAMN05444481_10331 [Flavobacterium frigidimaris]|jgi:hypothetical protein|nr:hypothetical protein SAMN05444481_10331 [Flavobacterium frigidimaris]